MISACCSFNIIVIRWALTWIHRTVRISCLTVVNPNRKVSDLYFKVVDPKLQVADLKAEVGSWDPAGSPNLTPAITFSSKRPFSSEHYVASRRKRMISIWLLICHITNTVIMLNNKIYWIDSMSWWYTIDYLGKFNYTVVNWCGYN